MTIMSSDKARENLPGLIDEVATSHQPVQIVGDGSTAVLVAEEDWRAIQKTLYLVSIPGMRDSIRDGLITPVEQCSEKAAW